MRSTDTADVNHFTQTAGSVAEKILKNGLTLKEESVIYATSRQSAKARRNCS